MNKMLITGYFVGNLEPTKEERLEELKSMVYISSVEELEQELSRWHVGGMPDWPIDDVWVWTQEEYDEIIRDLRTDHWTMYVIMDL